MDNQWNYVSYLYTRFPRQFSKPERIIVNNIEELTRLITMYYNSTRCGCTIYDYTPEHPPTIDRIVFDLDDVSRCFEDIKKLHKYFRHTKHFMVFSGKGFHCYIYTDNYNRIKDARTTLRAAYEDLQEKIGVKCDESLLQHGDCQPMGIPGTFNFREGRRRYVIFVDEEDLEKGYEHICKKAETPFHEMVVYGEDLLDIGKYDGIAPKFTKTVDLKPLKELSGLPAINEEWLKTMPDSIQNMLTNASKCNNRTRFLTTLYFKNEGYPMEFMYKVAEYFYSKLPHEDGCTMFDRYIRRDTLRQVYNNKKGYIFPSLRTLEKEGIIERKEL